MVVDKGYQQTESGIIEEISGEWEYIEIENLADKGKSSIKMGPFGSSLKKHELLDHGQTRVLWIENIVNNDMNLQYEKYITKQKYEELRVFTIKPGDVLITMMGTLGRIAVVPDNIGTAIISSHLLKITLDKNKCISKFLYYFLLSEDVKKQLDKESRGIVMQGLNTKIVKAIKVKLPPLNEQLRIVSVLSNVDKLIRKTDQLIEKTQRLKKGLMQKLLTKGIGHTRFKRTELGVIPEEWHLECLEEVCTEVTDGSHLSPKHMDSGFPLATVTNMKENHIDMESCYKISEKDFNSLVKNGCNINTNDILFSKDGTVGLCLVYNQDVSLVALSSIAIIRPAKEFHSYFGKYLLQSDLVLGKILGARTGTALKRIVLKDLRRIKIPIPPIKEQQKIAAILSNIDELIQEQRTNKSLFQFLKQGLMQKLLTGEIRLK